MRVRKSAKPSAEAPPRRPGSRPEEARGPTEAPAEETCPTRYYFRHPAAPHRGGPIRIARGR